MNDEGIGVLSSNLGKANMDGWTTGSPFIYFNPKNCLN